MRPVILLLMLFSDTALCAPVLKPPFSCENDYEKLIASLDSGLDSLNPLLKYFTTPKHIKVNVNNTNYPRFFPHNNQIDIPRKLSMHTAILEHEYGHALFYKNFSEFSPSWKQWRDSLEKTSAMTKKEAFRRLQKAKDSGLIDLEEYSQLYRRVAKEKPISIPLVPSQEVLELEKMSLPYQELFSDLLVITKEKDPTVVKSTVEALTKDKEKIDRRDFSIALLESSWKETADPHLLFSPVRSFLWQDYLSNERMKGQEAKFLKAVFDTISREILARVQAKSKNLTAAEANKRLLNALKNSLLSFE